MAAMALELDRLAFQSALHKAQGVIDKKSTVNVLSHLLLEPVGDGMVRLKGTDYDVVLEAHVPATILEGGASCVNGKSLFDVVRTLDQPTVTLTVLDNQWVEVVAGRSRFKLAGMPPTEFPNLEAPDGIVWLGLTKGVLKDLVDKTAFSVSDDETRMNLNGVFFRVEPSEEAAPEGGDEQLARVTMVSTDGHRLSRVQIDVEALGYESGQRLEAIVHKKGVSELKRLLDDDVERVDVGFAKGSVLFRAGGTTFTVRQIEDAYPDYQRVIPPSSPVRIELDRQRTIQALRRIAILTSSKTYIIKMEVADGQLTFSSSNPDYGEGRDVLDVSYDGTPMTVGFNYTYLLDVLNVLRSDTVVLELSDEYSPTVITAPTEPGALFVVMPMRI